MYTQEQKRMNFIAESAEGGMGTITAVNEVLRTCVKYDLRSHPNGRTCLLQAAYVKMHDNLRIM